MDSLKWWWPAFPPPPEEAEGKRQLPRYNFSGRRKSFILEDREQTKSSRFILLQEEVLFLLLEEQGSLHLEEEDLLVLENFF